MKKIDIPTPEVEFDESLMRAFGEDGDFEIIFMPDGGMKAKKLNKKENDDDTN